MAHGDAGLSGVRKKKNINNRVKKSGYAAQRVLYTLAGVVGLGAAFVSAEFETGEARAFELKEPIVLCELAAEDAFLRSFEKDEKKPKNSSAKDDCGSMSFIGEDFRSVGEREFEETLRTMVAGFPIERMLPSIVKYDREVAALLIGIAKKESNWGKRAPLDSAGRDCYNYWGFKAAGTRGIAMGHGCFGSPEEAVERVGNRIAKLAAVRSSEPARMIVWKCGSSCAGHSPESVQKWIADVSLYYNKLARL